MSASMSFHYRLFGLRIASEIELPELVADKPIGDVDVSIVLGRIPGPPEKPDDVNVDEQGASFCIDRVARYRTSDGCRIVVEPVSGAPARNIRLYLLGSAMGLLLHQRGCLPLHANAIDIGGQAFAFMGPSGAGKSTLAAAFHDRGYKVIADDVCVVSFDNGEAPVVSAGIPRLRLREQALEATGRAAADYEPSYDGDETFRKFDVPTVCEPSDPIPLAAIFELADGSEVELLRLGGVDAIEAIFANTYRGGFISLTGDPGMHWRNSVRLVSGVPIFKLRRPMELASIPQILDLLEEHVGLDLVPVEADANH